jgi:hypothetical protein
MHLLLLLHPRVTAHGKSSRCRSLWRIQFKAAREGHSGFLRQAQDLRGAAFRIVKERGTSCRRGGWLTSYQRCVGTATGRDRPGPAALLHLTHGKAVSLGNDMKAALGLVRDCTRLVDGCQRRRHENPYIIVSRWLRRTSGVLTVCWPKGDPQNNDCSDR